MFVENNLENIGLLKECYIIIFKERHIVVFKMSLYQYFFFIELIDFNYLEPSCIALCLYYIFFTCKPRYGNLVIRLLKDRFQIRFL